MLEEDLPIVTTELKRVGTMKILGVMLLEDFCFDTYVNNLCIRARLSVFARHVLAAHGLTALH